MFASVWDWQGKPDVGDFCCFGVPLLLMGFGLLVLVGLITKLTTRKPPRSRRR